jgi:DNA-binding SARP family transcriptional activator/tetratricopeptide (TPR) repeat protein
VEIRILGPLQVVDDGRDVTPARPKQRALLALLLLRANEVVANDDLVEALWGTEPPETAQTAVQGHVSALRKLLGAESIETRAPGYALRLRPDLTDIGRFDALLGEAKREPNPRARADLLRAALELFRGEPLSDFRYEAFARDEIGRLEELRLTAIEERIEAELELGGHSDVVAELERLVVANPLRERLRGQLMLALYRAGRQSEALHVYQEGRRVLVEELGLDPGAALQTLERQILSHDPDLEATAQNGRARATPREERKLVTILFCDLVGFTARAGELDPEDVRAVQRPYFERTRAEIERFGGTVEKFVGDAVMAVFGAPIAHEDDPERAVRAAFAVRDALAEEFEVRIAVHSGEALVTLDAEPRAGEGIVAGDVVNTASRLQAFAPRNGVAVGEVTFRATEHAIDYRALDPVTVKGKPEPIPLWEALGTREALAGIRRRADLPLVGRARELDHLLDAFERAVAAREPQLVTVIGVPGIGKSRILLELQGLLGDRACWRQGRSLPYGDGVTLWALGEVVKAHAGVLESDAVEVIGAKVESAAAAAVDEADRARIVRHLRPLLGLPSDGSRGEGGEGEAFAAWRSFLEGSAEAKPLVLVLEDLHWSDDRLLDFVEELAERAADVPLLIVCTARPELLERRPSWGGGKRNASAVSLAPLSSAETSTLVTSLLVGATLPDDDRARLVERAEGNPLYAEEYARLSVTRGAGGGFETPETLHGLIAARLDALSPPEKSLVQDAAVVGEVFWVDALAAIGERSSAAVDELLRSLERKEFLRRRRRSAVEGQTEYMFHHVLVRDVAYSQIPRGGRGTKHRIAAEWIERLGRREDHAEMLAHHHLRALELARAAREPTDELAARARGALQDAGDRAAALGAQANAARHYRASLDLCPEDHPERPALLLRLGRALLFAEVRGEQELLAAAKALVEAEDALGAADAYALLGTLYQEEGRGESTRQSIDRAHELVQALPRSRQKGVVLANVCRSRMMSAESAGAISAGLEALAIGETFGDDELRAMALNGIGPARCQARDLEGGIRDLERAIEIAGAAGSSEVVRGYGNLAHVLSSIGELPGALHALHAALEVADQFGLRWYTRWVRFELLIEPYLSGEWDELLRRLDEFPEERTVMGGIPRSVSVLVELGRGDVRSAVEHANVLLALARETRDPQFVGPALAIAALTRFRSGREDEGRALVEELTAWPGLKSAIDLSWAAPALGIALHAAGRSLPEELAARSKWGRAVAAFADGEFEAAAAIYADIDAPPDEAYARLRAGEALLAERRTEEAREQLDLACGFFRRSGASAYLAEAEALLERV